MHDIALTVNGRRRSGHVEARRTLVDFLRDDCALTGTHVGCEQGVCGSCTVLLNGDPVQSCLVLAVQADGTDVVTVEGIGNGFDELSPVQRALRDEHGVQCGFCTPGVVTMCSSLVREGTTTDEAAIRASLSGNLCRCTGYAGIVRAVQRVGNPAPDSVGRGGRREDARLLTGHGQFVADVTLPGMLHAAFVRSPVARGRITRLEVSAARGMDGVVAVLTATDLNPVAGTMRATPMLRAKDVSLRPLADTDVHFVGEPIAVVIAESRYIAEDAVDVIDVVIESCPPVLDPRAAADGAAERVFEELDSNIYEEMTFPIRPKLRTALASSPHVVRATFRQQRLANAPLETRGIVATFALGELHAWMSTQNPHEARLAISRVTGVPEHNVRVTAKDVGGSFGQKFWTGREELTVALAARVLAVPIKWIEDRAENLIAASHGRADEGMCTFALDEDGRFLGWHLDHVEDAGAYPSGVIGGAGPFVGMMFTGPYKVPMHAFRFRSVRTNTAPRGAYRGPWTFATVAREQMIDHTARAIGMDPLELRRRNVITSAELPYTMATRITLDRVTPAETLEQAAELIGYAKFREEQRLAFARDGRLFGIGLALYVEPSSGGTMDPISSDTATVRVGPSGAITVYLATGSHGQGVETTMAQLVGEELGVALDQVAVVQGDTAATPYGRGTGASGTAVITGGACRIAAAGIKEKATRIAAHVLGVGEGDVSFADGQFCAGTDKSIGWVDLASIAYHDTARLPAGESPGLEATGTYKAPPVTWSNACHACTVEVDRNSGMVKVLRYVVSEDCGIMINPTVVEGQIAGGVAQGIGAALYERVAYDAAGTPLSTSFLDYPLPTARDVPLVEIGHIETASDSPGGHKGMGQGGAVGSPPCVFNAVADALALVGVQVFQTPLTADAIIRALG